MTLVPRPFGRLEDGTPVEAVDLTGEAIAVTLTTLGAGIASLRTPDRNGHFGETVLPFTSLEERAACPPYCGASIGRFANRIAGGSFELDGTRHQLPRNHGANCLHGGPDGFDTRVWTIADLGTDPIPFVVFALDSPDGDAGFPGRLRVEARYALTGPGELTVEYSATTDRPTVVNLTNHAYFNLSADAGVGIEAHRLQIEADAMLPVDDGLVPTGEIRPVAGTAFDFREPRTFTENLQDCDDPQVLGQRGFDHCFVLRGGTTEAPRTIVRVEDARSGRRLDLLTTEPGLQLYSGHLLAAPEHGAPPAVVGGPTGFCLEPQRFPDAPNQPDFPSARLDPGRTCRQVAIYRFSKLDSAPDGGAAESRQS
ncbi:aldose epimerase family protein [Amorphus orientalis]|uniref:Aldose 1-epimerase n=1 Tax=Amorphus orientalis TaxID=649198 RepID=A0AAE3VKN2_9HYPH|nr:aldose epimerase family protein [Amorphus orientalis]MDQ0313762.1 aldose 1-epimerase [Amorphus orientalis]